MSHINRITHEIIGAGIRIHRRLGSGLLESAYHDLMRRDLIRAGYFVESRKRVGFEFEGSWIENGFTTDLIVERTVIVELKVAVALAPVHERQLLTYLRLTELPIGLLINFGGEVLYRNIRRFVNNLIE
jgi:GxxExxY protein